jgi:UDP-N-acetyl-D-galactosamine dehydrogenase
MDNLIEKSDISIAVVGLGYVGLPLAIALGKFYRTIGFDISSEKISSLSKSIDPNNEVSSAAFLSAKRLVFSFDADLLTEADLIVIAVPTPVDQAHIPNFAPLVSASEIVGSKLKKNATVVYESTVYPGATEEICVPVLERCSGMRWKEDFFVGYSPERINPGDKDHTLKNVVKVLSGDVKRTVDLIKPIYERIVNAGVHIAPSIKVAEAAKVIENTQRDLNIALMNELAIIFDLLDIDTTAVLDAASTKWNFMRFHPGLVGGHCIGVDPYYLTHKADMVGYKPQVILAGRRINDGMGKYVAEKVIKSIAQRGIQVAKAKINILGLTFKEDCSDIRNSKVVDLINELKEYGCDLMIHDPLVDSRVAMKEYGIRLVPWERLHRKADALVLAVAHENFLRGPVSNFSPLLATGGTFADIKAAISLRELEKLDAVSWRL